MGKNKFQSSFENNANICLDIKEKAEY